GQNRIGAGNDSTLDQSYLLGLLHQFELQGLNLPLSEMRMEEVLKLSKNLGFENIYEVYENLKITQNEYLAVMAKIVPERVYPKLIEEGPFFSLKKVYLGDHNGLYLYRVGQKNLKQKNAVTMIDK